MALARQWAGSFSSGWLDQQLISGCTIKQTGHRHGHRPSPLLTCRASGGCPLWSRRLHQTGCLRFSSIRLSSSSMSNGFRSTSAQPASCASSLTTL